MGKSAARQHDGSGSPANANPETENLNATGLVARAPSISSHVENLGFKMPMVRVARRDGDDLALPR
jgi:hypothetical protein